MPQVEGRTVVKRSVALMALCALAAGPAGAVLHGQAPDDEARVREQIANMENAFRLAVHRGAGNVVTEMKKASPPAGAVSSDLMLVSPPEATGIRVRPHGMVFYVRVPQMNGNVLVSAAMLAPPQQFARRPPVQSQQQEIPRGQAVAQTVTEAAPEPRSVLNSVASVASFVNEFRAAYKREIKESLIETMINNGLTLRLAPGERLTVAARGDTVMNLLDPSSAVLTTTFTVTSDTLDAYSQKRISYEEARKAVLVDEY
jgi:hypothetical protein